MANGQDGWIEVKGARTHNLKDITVELPKGKFVVISGVSGSENPVLLSTPSMPKASAVTLRAFLRTPASSSVK